MASRRAKAEEAIKGFLKRRNKTSHVDLDTSLFAEGIGLDSLETAELSVLLEDELGHDPFSEGDMPQTVGEVVDYYGAGESDGDDSDR